MIRPEGRLRAIRRRSPGTTIEVLTPDFQGDYDPVRTVVEARPDIYNHNTETVPRLYARIRPKAIYANSLALLRHVKALAPEMVTKSGLMVGLGETDAETGRKVTALLGSGLTPVLCVGERLAERDAGRTLEVVERQLGAIADLDAERLGRVIVAYEPVWAIGTGRNATPGDAAEGHAAIRRWFGAPGGAPEPMRILYGGSVNLENVASLVAESEIDGVLVGGASLDAAKWARLVSVGTN